MIREAFLHYLWQHKLFNTTNLVTTTNETLQILKVGSYNTNSGPDFFNALLIINGQKWAGNVEIHINATDWYVHNHEQDNAYNTVILHIVWHNDIAVYNANNAQITTLELKKYVPIHLLNRYKKLFFKNKKFINCEKDSINIPNFTLNNWLEKLYLERLEQKSVFIVKLLKKSHHNWEEVLFKLLAKNFGLKVNGDAFLNLANSFDFSVLRKCFNTTKQLESLLFGQANLLHKDCNDLYFKSLKETHTFLAHKFKLTPICATQIKFFRLRPTNFPTIRLSQLANLYVKKHALFSDLMAIRSLDAFYELFGIGVSSYWENHYSFDVTSKKSTKKLTKNFIDLLLINTIIPLQFIYQKQHGNLNIENLLRLINQIKPEQNSIINAYTSLGIKSHSALKTQALLQLHTNYCKTNNCLRCVIGNVLFQKKVSFL